MTGHTSSGEQLKGVPLKRKGAAAAFVLIAVAAGYYAIGIPPVVIVGGSGIVGFVLWLWTYRNGIIDPAIILPPFLLTVAALEVHMIEEYLAKFGPAMSRLFDISWSEESFLMIFAFVGPVLYALTALGLFWRHPLAGSWHGSSLSAPAWLSSHTSYSLCCSRRFSRATLPLFRLEYQTADS